MSICVSVRVSEGLVLAADSTATIQGTVQVPNSPPTTGVLKTFDHARKLSHVKDYPIGTLTWGLSQIGARTVDSLIKEFEYSLPSLEEESEKLRERRMRGESVDKMTYEYKTKTIAEGLLSHVGRFYNGEFASLPLEQRPPLGVLVSGYSSGEFFPEQWLIQLPIQDGLQQVRPDVGGKPDFGANWYGLTDAIVRLHWGRDDAIVQQVANHLKTTPEEIAPIMNSAQYMVPFAGMPLQDAIDYAVYLVNVTIGRFRFVVGAPVCGGEVDVAVMAPGTFTWISRKMWKA
jgi:hypothetical protein